MTTKNKVQLAGRLGMDPEMRTTPGGVKMAKLRLAVSESYRNGNGDFVKQTHWFSIVAWGKVAEQISGQFVKGNEVTVEGKLVNNEYTDKNGMQRKTIDIQALQVVRTEQNEPETA
jgi:single-strand DNA-binding protein